MDTVTRRRDDDGRSYVDGAVAGASAMVGVGKGERQGACEVSAGSRRQH